MQHPLSKRSQGLLPKPCGLRKLGRELSGEPTISVSFLEEPFPLQQRATQPTQHKGIDLRTNRFHQIASKTVPCARVTVKNSDSGIKADLCNCEPRLRFQYRIEIVEHCVWRIHSESR